MIMKIFKWVYFLIVGLFFLFIAYVLLEYRLYKNVFLKQRDEVRVQFDKANEALLAEFPPPVGVQEINRNSGSDGFGVSLFVDYQIMGTTPQATRKYYEKRLAERGFLPLGPYVRGTACIAPMIDPERDQYYVIFWVDYRKQSFSPRVPPDWLVYFVGYSEKKVLTCPDQPSTRTVLPFRSFLDEIIQVR